jgi:hypothetical protein
MYDLAWLEHRQNLFEKYTLPSIEGQHNKDFEWLLISDARTPDKFKNVMDKYPARVVYKDWTRYQWAELPGIKRNSPMGLAVRIETINDVVAEAIGQQTVPVITSRLDNDDIVAKEHMQRIRAYSEELWETKGPKFWVTMTRGWRYCQDNIYPINSKCSSFVSFVESPENLETCYPCLHTMTERDAKQKGYPFVIIREGEPTWAELIHPNTVMNRLKRYRGEQPVTKEFLRRFSING